jgi:hypothetical protein
MNVDTNAVKGSAKKSRNCICLLYKEILSADADSIHIITIIGPSQLSGCCFPLFQQRLIEYVRV